MELSYTCLSLISFASDEVELPLATDATLDFGRINNAEARADGVFELPLLPLNAQVLFPKRAKPDPANNGGAGQGGCRSRATKRQP